MTNSPTPIKRRRGRPPKHRDSDLAPEPDNAGRPAHRLAVDDPGIEAALADLLDPLDLDEEPYDDDL